MGIGESKLAKKLPEDEVPEEEGSIPSTPILTPKMFKKTEPNADLDPRSPSKHIARTPVELLAAAAAKLQIGSLEKSDETPLKKHIFLGIDPRSPSVEIQRTPIVVTASPDKKLPEKLLNKNLDKVRNSSLIDTPTRVSENKVNTPRLLESSPITPKPEAYKRKSFVGLLETNIDYTETDLDAVIKEKYLGKTVQNVSALECEIDDHRSPAIDFLHTPIQKEQQVCEDVNNLENNEEHQLQTEDSDETDGLTMSNQENSDPEPSITVISPVPAEKETILLGVLKEEPKVIHSAPVSPPNIVSVTPKKSKSQPVTPPVIDLTADVKELDQKLTHLIYEDEDLVVCPRIVRIKDLHRIPLAPRNGTDDRKSAAKLKVSDKPRKLEYAVSKIPVFKEKKVKGQCENTPPKGMERARGKKSQWDPKDDTMLI